MNMNQVDYERCMRKSNAILDAQYVLLDNITIIINLYIYEAFAINILGKEYHVVLP